MDKIGRPIAELDPDQEANWIEEPKSPITGCDDADVLLTKEFRALLFVIKKSGLLSLFKSVITKLLLPVLRAVEPIEKLSEKLF